MAKIIVKTKFQNGTYSDSENVDTLDFKNFTDLYNKTTTYRCAFCVKEYYTLNGSKLSEAQVRRYKYKGKG